MKKSMILCTGMCIALAFTGCKSKESAYRQAYEKAQAAEAAAEAATTVENQPVVTPLQERPITENKVVDNMDNVSVRQENLTVVSGSGLRSFSVVVGSFSVKANAEGLQKLLINAGYNAQIAYNSDRNMYRVIASTFDNKYDAVQSREQLRGKYPDAWLLFNQ
ncbi:MAG: SPOR domain-containing protein [Prevotella sp.]|nr:SPOR domain-containing protein [Prevotella sp.]MBQ9179087.1 SPOR domain-containing protein [Prevotella sp.]MBQ9670597.1 SPOR domain-containing protein [Prevotella sp.]MBR1526094.1 SPOR domain-containing protein [Prevotella sp.]MDY6230178.1 SPOR domain-containing protein [Prevotella sp.]